MAVELIDDVENGLSQLKFAYALRTYQSEILELVNVKLEKGRNSVHVVAPPGAGKTIIGLQLVAQLKLPTVIFCPNTTIQAQWKQKLDLFLPPGMQSSDLLGTHEDAPLKPITVLTYQVLSTPDREREYLDKLAHKAWIEEITGGPGLSAGEAELRILEIRRNNPAAYDKEMSRHASRLRRRLTDVLELDDVLHPNALQLIQTLRRQKFKLVLFDECHHLTDYWAVVMMRLVSRLNDPIVVGLTGTPPEGKASGQENRYLNLVGDIDYQVPTAALVREGGLAPFQDLAYFTHPTDKEFKFLETQHYDLHSLLEELSRSSTAQSSTAQVSTESALTKWIEENLAQCDADKWDAFTEENAQAIGRYCWNKKLQLPSGMSFSQEMRCPLILDDWMELLEDFALNKLKVSGNPADHKLYERIKAAVRKIGYALTEGGMRRQATPVDRVLAYSESKAYAAAEILATEYGNLRYNLRAIVVTDFERMSATEMRSAEGVLSEESGGALGVMQRLIGQPVSEFVNPCLVTGSLLVIDERIASTFIEAANAYIAAQGDPPTLETSEAGPGLIKITAKGGQWDTRLYVGMTTAIFEQGITRCLVGTRGIFGEGWDSPALNTLIDLTTTTSPVSVKQLRGRSIRIDNKNPLGILKVANNWDVICAVPELEKGMNDYERFLRKQDGYFGIADDGQIECGAGHIHPSLDQMSFNKILSRVDKFNALMIKQAADRGRVYLLWNVGTPYANRILGGVEVWGFRNTGLTPPYIHKNLNYAEHVAMIKSALKGIWFEYLGLTVGLVMACSLILWRLHLPQLYVLAPLVLALFVANERHSGLYKSLRTETCRPVGQQTTLQQMGTALLTTLQELKEINRGAYRQGVKTTVREDGSVRVFLEGVQPSEAQKFASCFKELLSPLEDQSHYISKHEFVFSGGDKKDEERFFSRYLKGKAQLEVVSIHPLPEIVARTEKSRQFFASAWNKYVGPGSVEDASITSAGVVMDADAAPILSTRLLWE